MQLKSGFFTKAAQRIDLRKRKARARRDFAATIGEGIAGQKLACEQKPVETPARPIRLAEDCSDNGRLAIRQKKVPKLEFAGVSRGSFGDGLPFGLPSDPNTGRKETRKRRRVRHSIVDGRWRYVSVFVYEYADDAGAEWLNETTLGERLDKRDTVGHSDHAATPLSSYASTIVDSFRPIGKEPTESIPAIAEQRIAWARWRELREAGRGPDFLASEFNISRAEARAIIRSEESIP
jgi:hypothetical protein